MHHTLAIVLAMTALACSDAESGPRQQVEAYCETNETATVCREPGVVTVDCFQGVQPVTNGTCTLALHFQFPGDSLVEPYPEDIYCCSDH